MDPAVLLSSGIVAAVVGGLVGGVVGYLVARLQRTWDLDARRAEDRKARFRAAIDVITKFMDAVELAHSRRGPLPLHEPLTVLTNSDRWSLASVLRLFPGVETPEAFFYPPNFIAPGGTIREINIADTAWIPIRDVAGNRLAILTTQLEKLGDDDLRNFEQT